MQRVIVLLLAAAAALGGIAAFLLTRFEGPPLDTTAALVPADAAVYVNVFVDPSTDQKKLLRDRVEEAADGADAGSLVEGVLDRVTRSYGLGYEDVSPWVGRQFAVFATPRRGGAVIAEVADADAAREVLERVGGRLVGEHAVFGDPRAVRAVVQVHATGPLGPADGGPVVTREVFDDVPQDRLAFAVVRSGLVDLPEGLDAVELLLGVGQGNALSLRASKEGFVVDGYSYSDGAELLLSGEDNEYFDLGSAGKEAWLAAVVPNLSAAVEGLDRELARAARLGSVPPIRRSRIPRAIRGTDQTLVWVGGTGPQSFAAGIESATDGPKASGRLARALVDFLPVEPTLEFGNARLLATFGPSRGRLDSTERFREAADWLGDLIPIGYVDVEASRPLLPFAAAAAGIEAPDWFLNLDRLAVGIDQEAAPTHWRVISSLE